MNFIASSLGQADPFDTRAGRPTDLTQLLARAAEWAPDTVLTFVPERGEPVLIRHAWLLARARRGAAALRGLGAQPGEKVALLLDDGVDFLTGLWSAILAGLVPVPLAPVRND